MTLIYDVIIIGSGPAAYTAGIYTGRGNVKSLILESYIPGGQLLTTTFIENYPGIAEIEGYQLMMNMKTQAEDNGCETIPREAVKLEQFENIFRITDSEGDIYTTKSVILAMGANAKKLQFRGSETFWNKGISACAVCDGALPIFRDKVLVVIGGGDSAMEEALFLSRFASQVLICVRSNNLRASKIMVDRVLENPKIKILYNTEVTEAFGKDLLEEVELLNKEENLKSVIECNGIFYAIGHSPNTDLIKGMIELDDKGYIKRQSLWSTKTNIPGIFSAGDISDSIYRQAITAAGNGCMAGLDVLKYLEEKID